MKIMKNKILFLIALIINLSASCQSNAKLSDYFPELQNIGMILKTREIWKLNTETPLDTTIALKYFFDNKSINMHDTYEAYNMDENTYTSVPYLKQVYPLYKIKHDSIYLLCYSLESIEYLIMYNAKKDIIESSFIIDDNSEEGDVYTRSTLFPNGYIVTVQSQEKGFYILSKIDYVSHKFIEIKKIEFNQDQSYDEIQNKVFEILGISKEGNLLENN